MSNIICRLDPFKAIPVVFLVDSYSTTYKEILAWTDGKAAKPVNLEYYRQTLPLSEADEEKVTGMYKQATGDNEVIVRHRLPRLKRPLPNIFAGNEQSAALKPGDVDFKAAMDALQAEMADKVEALHRAWRNQQKK